MTKNEKKILMQSVNTMNSFGIKFQENEGDDEPVYEPDLIKILNYDVNYFKNIENYFF